MSDKLRIDNSDDGDHYGQTDSEEERELLQEVRRGRTKHHPTTELYAFDDSDDEISLKDGNDDIVMNDSDFEGAQDDDNDIPDAKDWGSQSRNYYNTDFVDQDYSAYNEQEEEMAKQEEEEAKIIQLRLAKQMKEDDFLLEGTNLKITSTNTCVQNISLEKSTKLKADFSGLSKRERRRLFQEGSPEFDGLVADFEDYFNESEALLLPVLRHVYEHKVPMIPALEFAQLYQNIIFTYCSNVTFYLLLKAKRISVRNHPITKRLMQLKKLLMQLKEKHDNIIKPQLEALLERIVDCDEFEVLDFKPKVSVDKANKILSMVKESSNTPSDGSDDESKEGEEQNITDVDGEIVRRGITYQIAKNKGLMPSRKKEQRNPRVKHRSKFRKALIRRKGAVRTVRTEVKRYGGEISGIKATVSKSIKFKS